MKDKNYKIFKWILRSLAAVFIMILLNRLFIFTGKVEYTQDFSSNKEYISRILPSSNTSGLLKDLDNKVSYQILNQGTGYFNVKIPHGAEKLDLEIKIANPAEEINLAIPISKYQSAKKKVFSKVLNDINKEKWNKLSDKDRDLTLWQKKQKFNSVDDFLSDMPEKDVIFSITSNSLVQMPDYSSKEEMRQIDWPLRGPHKIYAYIGEGEKLSWKFFYQELGANKDDDPFILRLYYNDVLLQDINIENHNQYDSYLLERGNLQEGVYLIELPESFDILFSKMETKQQLFALGDRADFYNANKESNLYILGDNLRCKTIHSAGYQNVIINEQEIGIEEANKYYSYVLDKSQAYFITIPKSDLTIETDGFIYTNENQQEFAQQLYKMKEINSIQEPDFASIKYVLTDYNEPEISGNDIILKTSFNITNVQLDENNNLPVNIYLSEVPSNGLKFYNIKAIIHRSFIEYLKNLF
jgi:hypothetical protein